MKRRGASLFALLVLLVAVPLAPALAQTTKFSKRPALSDTRFTTLTPDSAFSGTRRSNDGTSVYSRIAPADPFGGSSVEATSSVYLPLSQQLSSLVETTNATGNFVSERSVLGQIGASFGAWRMHAGVRRSELSYDNFTPGLGLSAFPGPTNGGPFGADLGMVTVERFWDRYRGAYTVASGRADGGATATSHRVELSYFYDANSSVGMSYTTGRSFENGLGLGTMTPLESNNVGVIGEHWFSPSWALNYNALIEDHGFQGGLKPELRVGLRLRF